MRARRSFDATLIALLLGNCVLTAALAARGEPGDLRQFKLDQYTFSVPSNWTIGRAAEQRKMRSTLPNDPNHEITNLKTFATNPMGCIVTVYSQIVPPEERGDYLDRMRNLNRQKFEAGRAQGLVANVSENRRAGTPSVDALLIDWESTRGALPRFRQWLVPNERHPTKTLAVMANCTTEQYGLVAPQVDRIAASIRIEEK